MCALNHLVDNLLLYQTFFYFSLTYFQNNKGFIDKHRNWSCALRNLYLNCLYGCNVTNSTVRILISINNLANCVNNATVMTVISVNSPSSFAMKPLASLASRYLKRPIYRAGA